MVIGLQSTGETGVEHELNRGEIITDFISAPAACLRRLLYKCFPLPKIPKSHQGKRKLEQLKSKMPHVRKLRRLKRSSVLFADDTDSSGDLSSAELPDAITASTKRKSVKSVLSDDSSVEFVGFTRQGNRNEGMYRMTL